MQFRADDQLQPVLLRGDVGPHDAGEAVAVGDGESVVAASGRGGDQLVGVGGPFEEGVVRLAVQLGVGGHCEPPVQAPRAAVQVAEQPEPPALRRLDAVVIPPH